MHPVFCSCISCRTFKIPDALEQTGFVSVQSVPWSDECSVVLEILWTTVSIFRVEG
jgi:hypothetical protein